MEREEIVLTEKLVPFLRGEELPKRYRAVLLLEHSWGSDPIINIEQPIDVNDWHSTGGFWYVKTLLENPRDQIWIDGGQDWGVKSGLLDALKKAVEIIEKEEAA